jgi:hypothetical protein
MPYFVLLAGRGRFLLENRHEEKFLKILWLSTPNFKIRLLRLIFGLGSRKSDTPRGLVRCATTVAKIMGGSGSI